ncbi:MAG TPA: DNA topoisomerase VI subunit B [Candidatus Saccharimonadales bacterium]|nr:DNA topoisomerase VI subunit B [Candidatus Saccharimonadales bacterium]
MAAKQNADDIFKEFKEHSISEFFRRNSQMLGYSGKVRSLTTIIHEYLTNSLDACEEADILPDIKVKIKELGESKYAVTVLDNGPGIPSKLVGKALATVLAGTKFHRYKQQRGQQGIGAAGCTLFSKITTGKSIHVKSGTSREKYECDITLDIKSNRPLIENLNKVEKEIKGTEIYAEFGEVKYEKSDHGVYEYIKRTALSNPHVSITLVEPDGNEAVFLRATSEMPKKAREILPHPLGITTNDLVEFAQRTESRKITSFLTENFARVTPGKIDELRAVVKGIDLDSDPKKLSWQDAEKLVAAFKQIKWMAPELDSLSEIGEKQIDIAIKNILNPVFQSVIERKPKVFRGGIPFIVEAGIAYGGNSGKPKELTAKEREAQTEDSPLPTAEGNVLRFANKVPLLFDASNCAITEAVKTIDWKRYAIMNFDEEPISVLVNVSSVYVPYSGVGKQAVSQEEEIIDEIKLAVQDCARTVQRYLSGVRNQNLQESRYKTIIRYVSQLSSDLGEITGTKKEEIEKSLRSLVEKRYNVAEEAPEEEEKPAKKKAKDADEEETDKEEE